jgi:GTP-binding protein LepA
MDLSRIRNFSIIAHIDHGKSTLADRMLEITKTIDKRQMQDQVLDDMELERERGITIKMRPVRMSYAWEGKDYVFNLIDTPGHIDFSYEVSRALQAVEGTVLLVDSTQGVQAQTISVLTTAKALGLTIIPVLSKVDSPRSRIDEVTEEICELIDCMPDDVILTSGKTGEGVEGLLQEVIKRVPPPKTTYSGAGDLRSLIFDFQYSNHKGVIVYTRMLDGSIRKGDQVQFVAAGEKFYVLEVGIFAPAESPRDELAAGEIGYVVTGIKQPGIASVGDTLVLAKNPLPPLEGYDSPKPVVWASIFPESQDDFDTLRQALQRLRLSDSSFTFEEESSTDLGRGFRSGFLGMLHLDIITERLHREFQLNLVVTLPSITYEVTLKSGKVLTVYSPQAFPDYGDVVGVREPWTNVTIITPEEYLSGLMQVFFNHEAEIGETNNFGTGRVSISAAVPLRELMRNFFDDVKSVSSGYASLSYEWGAMRDADVVKVEMLVADEVVPAFTRIVARRRLQEECEKMTKRLHTHLPRQMFTTKIQAKALGRIVSSETLSAMSKNVTDYLYGGDITRKMKLREKQKKGKKKMKARGTVNISHDVFLKMIRPE